MIVLVKFIKHAECTLINSYNGVPHFYCVSLPCGFNLHLFNIKFQTSLPQLHIIWSSETGNVRASSAVARERAMGLKLHMVLQVSSYTHVKSARNPKFWHDSLLKKQEKYPSTLIGWTSFISSFRDNTVARDLRSSISLVGKGLTQIWKTCITLDIKN